MYTLSLIAAPVKEGKDSGSFKTAFSYSSQYNSNTRAAEDGRKRRWMRRDERKEGKKYKEREKRGERVITKDVSGGGKG